MQRIGLIVFGLLFALLFLGVAAGVGIGGGSSIPRDAVAVVEGAPAGLDVITKAEFAHEMKVQALEKGFKAVPAPASPEYSQLKRKVMGRLIGVDWVEAQAIRMGLAPTPREIKEKLSPGEGAAMKELGLTEKDIDARMRWFLAGDKIQEMLREKVREPSGAEIQSYYEENRTEEKSLAEMREEIIASLRGQREKELLNQVQNRYRSEWAARTRCARGFAVVEECSNYPPFGHPITTPDACYEVNPREPAEECQAPVISSKPSQPGSVTWWNPEGERLVQRPVPAGGPEAETSSE